MNVLETLNAFHDRLLDLASAFAFNKCYAVDLHRIALYGSMLELTGGICTLMRHNGRIGVPSLFRSFLEAGVELRNLMADPDYVHHMTAAHVEQWVKVLKEARGGANSYLGLISDIPDLDAQIAKHEAELTALVNSNWRPLSVFERFERANMVEEYRSLYNFLSCDAHSNVRALITRHVELQEDDFGVIYYKDEPIDSFVSVLDSTAGLLLQAAESMHGAYAPAKSPDIRAMFAELTTLRARYVD